jgi:hypothetical protein|tara:strand:+ start:113 stop:271 length:159 start_codon:yes stop_codon:yes gene_type:complete
MVLEEQLYRPKIYPTDSRVAKIVDNWGSLHRENKHWKYVPVEKPKRRKVKDK